MISAATKQLYSIGTTLNPYNWDQKTKNTALKTAMNVSLVVLAIYALLNIPGASSEKISDNEYNNLRTIQDSISGDSNPVEAITDAVTGMLVGRENADGLAAGRRVRQEGGGVVHAVVETAFTTFRSNMYRQCIEDADGFFAHLMCQVWKP